MKHSLPLWLGLVALAATACNKSTPDAASTAAPTTAGEKAEAFGQLTVDAVASKMDEAKNGKLALFLYDANAKTRYEAGHLPGAKWIGSDLDPKLLPADKDATLVFYCSNEH